MVISKKPSKSFALLSFRTPFHVDFGAGKSTAKQKKTSLQAALGVVEEVVLDDAVQAFFDSPEIGLIRAKEVHTKHGKFACDRYVGNLLGWATPPGSATFPCKR